MFITFEGMDGSGKSTQVKQTTSYLKSCDFDVVTTREPGGTLIGDQVRTILFGNETNPAPVDMQPETELLLFNASRAQLVEEVIRPHLDKGGIVVCDRYTDSTLAYQGYGHGLNIDMLQIILHFATGGLQPDLTLYLDIDPEVALKRRMAASLFGEQWNRLDDMELAFHQRVYAGYNHLIAANPDRWVRIDATQTVEKVHRDIMQTLQRLLPETEQSNG